MIELFTTYSLSEVIILIIILCLAIKEAVTFYDWSKNKGYPTPKHRAAIREHGTTPYHRMTFNLLGEDPQLSFDF